MLEDTAALTVRSVSASDLGRMSEMSTEIEYKTTSTQSFEGNQAPKRS